MNAPPAGSTKATVLLVDDEAVSRKMMEYFLSKSGFSPVSAPSAAAARAIVAESGPGLIDCVVTDYNMPGETGLELLFWLRQNDPTLAVIMVTATTERETVAATLRGGASDFLDKPIAESELVSAVRSGVATTAERRKLVDAEKAVREVGRAQYRMFGLGSDTEAGITVCHHPWHAAGGDFVNCFQTSPSRYQVLVADVSGHDLHAAYVAAYFQGMARGLFESGQPLTSVLGKFNNLLLLQSGSGSQGGFHSICACIVEVDLDRLELALCDYGIPAAHIVSAEGRVSVAEINIGSPLGWFEELEFKLAKIHTRAGGHLHIWTDGLEDLANTLGVSPFCLSSILVRARLGQQALPDLSLAKDDVLALQIPLSSGNAGIWFPVLMESYCEADVPEIDESQGRWQRSLKLALPELTESRLFDLLLSVRETVLNGVKHGCAGRPGETCDLAISASTERRIIRVFVSDTGQGHSFDWSTHHQDPMLADLHRGLALINRLATKVTSERNGADLTLDFSY
jgi:FixJ family two-component response regulator/anti-sigma regulatory factor (Ser/Thr protein kinase)